MKRRLLYCTVCELPERGDCCRTFRLMISIFLVFFILRFQWGLDKIYLELRARSGGHANPPRRTSTY